MHPRVEMQESNQQEILTTNKAPFVTGMRYDFSIPSVPMITHGSTIRGGRDAQIMAMTTASIDSMGNAGVNVGGRVPLLALPPSDAAIYPPPAKIEPNKERVY